MASDDVSHETITEAYQAWAKSLMETRPNMTEPPWPGMSFRAGAQWAFNVSHETMHISLLCSIQTGNPHNPCSGTCDGHGAGKPCDLPCQCTCHHVPRETIASQGFELWYRSIARFHGPGAGGQGFDISDLADAFTAGDAFGRGPVVPRETKPSDVSHETMPAGIISPSQEEVNEASVEYVQTLEDRYGGYPDFGLQDIRDGFATGVAWTIGQYTLQTPDVSHETVQARADAYRQATADRDQLVRDMKAEGIGPSEIARQTGIARSTIGRLLGAKWTYNHGKFQQSVPRETKPE